MLPAVLELLGPVTWKLPSWLDARLAHFYIEGSAARGAEPAVAEVDESAEREPAGVGG
jgi:hypothetical protein